MKLPTHELVAEIIIASIAQVTALLRRIAGLPISVEPIEARYAFEQILAVARQQNLTEYDSVYLELALRAGLPLATLDEKLKKAGSQVGRRWISENLNHSSEPIEPGGLVDVQFLFISLFSEAKTFERSCSSRVDIIDLLVLPT